jgi:hypothetical protein
MAEPFQTALLSVPPRSDAPLGLASGELGNETGWAGFSLMRVRSVAHASRRSDSAPVSQARDKRSEGADDLGKAGLSMIESRT